MSTINIYAQIAYKYGDEFAKQLVYSVINTSEDSYGQLNFHEFKDTKVSAPSAKAE